jgi:hypothetical protein
MRALAAAIPPARLEVRRPTLEDVFVRIVAGERGGAVGEDRRLRDSLRDAGASAEVRG